jgi:hypothetical protein
MKTYFDTAVRENRYYSEDWTFCENWRDLGGQVWVDKRVLLRHTGTYVFDGTTQEKLYHDLAAVFAPAKPAAEVTGMVPQGGHDISAEQLNVEPEATVIASNIEPVEQSAAAAE